jgi:chromosome segregation ATPase
LRTITQTLESDFKSLEREVSLLKTALAARPAASTNSSSSNTSSSFTLAQQQQLIRAAVAEQVQLAQAANVCTTDELKRELAALTARLSTAEARAAAADAAAAALRSELAAAAAAASEERTAIARTAARADARADKRKAEIAELNSRVGRKLLGDVTRQIETAISVTAAGVESRLGGAEARLGECENRLRSTAADADCEVLASRLEACETAGRLRAGQFDVLAKRIGTLEKRVSTHLCVQCLPCCTVLGLWMLLLYSHIYVLIAVDHQCHC